MTEFMVQRDCGPIPCKILYAFCDRGGTKELEMVIIRQDGVIEIDCQHYTYEQLEAMVKCGSVSSRLQDGDETLLIGLLCRFVASQAVSWIEESDFLIEVQDIIESLNGRSTTVTRCAAAHEEFNKNPSDQNRERLRVAFHEIPSHLQLHLGGFRRTDVKIRRILGEDD